MGLFSSPIKTLDDLFVHTLRDMYYVEREIVENLPDMIEKASSQRLKAAFQHHLTETKQQVVRLEKVFAMHGEKPSTESCASIDGILSEAEDIISDCDDKEVRDAAMLSAAQAIEHYEITRYGTMIAFARQLGRQECAALLAETLQEEKAADSALTAIAEERVNLAAA